MINQIIKSINYRLNIKQNKLIKLIEEYKILSSKNISNFNEKKINIQDLSELEYSVFSQWGEDGIINWLIKQIPDINKTFIEFGVENYTESNTRLLFQEYNWSGLIIDNNKKNIEEIFSSDYYWKGNLTALNQFIKVDNINSIFKDNNFINDIGLLSIDIDGNDYWIWNAINNIDPVIVVCEYNGIFGNKLSLTIPYQENFDRSKAHYSHLYFGCSIKALIDLGEKKDYFFIGTNLNGNNAFFIKNKYRKNVNSKIKNIIINETKFRESRNINNNLDYKDLKESLKMIENLPLYNINDNQTYNIKDLLHLF